MATPSLAPADEAILAMSSSEFLNMTNPNHMDPYSPSECSPVSSVFSSMWSRRPSASSTGSQATDDDDVDECPNHDHYQPLKQSSYAPQNLSLEPPEALTIAACIVHLDQETLEPGVFMIQRDNEELELPHKRVSEDDLSISSAVTQTIKDQTSLSINKIVGVLPETRHHLHDPKDIPSPASNSSQEAVSLDLTCTATAASLAAAHAARMARNISISTTACDICDFMPASKRRDALLNWRKMARRNRANSSASRWSRYSDSSSSSASEGAASDSDESTCRLLRDEVSTTTTTTTITTITKALAALSSEEKDQETDGALYMKIPPKSVRNSRKTSPNRLRVKYKPLAQEPPPTTTNIGEDDDDDDSSSTNSDSESDDFLSDNEGAALNQPSTMLSNSQQHQQPYLITTTTSTTAPIPSSGKTKNHLEAIQLNYIVLSTESTTTPLSTNNNKLSLITSSNLQQHRMSPQTRTLVQQALTWASGYFYPISPLDPDEENEDEDDETRHASVEEEEETNNFADCEGSVGSGNDSSDESSDEGAPLSPYRSR